MTIKHEIEPRIDGPRKPSDPIGPLDAPEYASPDLNKAIAVFTKHRIEVLTTRAAALDTLSEAMDAVSSGRFSHKNLPAIEKAKADLLVADAQEINLCRMRSELHSRFEPECRAARDDIQARIDARRDEICEESEKLDESPIVLDAKIRTDKKIMSLIESAPPEIDTRGINIARTATEDRAEYLRSKLEKILSV